jgi:hypothetical protein
LTHLRTQKTILGIVFTILLSNTGAFAQEQLSPEKKKELRKFDPADIVPEAREGEPRGVESQDGRRRTQSRRTAGTPASSAPISAAVDSTFPIPAAPAAKAPLSPRTAPSLAPKGTGVLTQSAVTKIQPSAQGAPAPAAQGAPAPAAQGAPAPAVAVNKSGSSARLSLPLILFLLSLILFALVTVVVRLKKDLSKL